ncbi:MAG TPA: cytochrome c [Xanthobacteraceae bacterium]|nr:cytochrome c [Xanthobacteraceae bacterium]
MAAFYRARPGGNPPPPGGNSQRFSGLHEDYPPFFADANGGIRMLRVLCAVTVAAVTLSATMVLAQQNPILARQEIMKKSDEDLKALSKILRDEAPFDAAKVRAAYATMEDSYKKVQSLFPDNSKTGEKTRASPKIWENRADFDVKMAAFIKVAGDAKTKATNEAAFKEVHQAVIKGCDNCHADYRLRRQP